MRDAGSLDDGGVVGCCWRSVGAVPRATRLLGIAHVPFSAPISPTATDSGTKRNEDGSALVPFLSTLTGGESSFGRPRAAAAQDSRVERLARSAASWSARYDGDIILNGLC